MLAKREWKNKTRVQETEDDSGHNVLFLLTMFCCAFPSPQKYPVIVLQSCRRHILTVIAVTSLFRQGGDRFASIERQHGLDEVVSMRENAKDISIILE